MRPMLPAVCLAAALISPSPLRAAVNEWKAISPEELALKAPKIDPEAGAEALLWEVRIADEVSSVSATLRTVFHHYVRVKVFNTRGREAFATVDIPYAAGSTITDVAARTVRPDGTILELETADVYRRTVVKAGDLQVSVVSFAVPGIDIGTIVEYQWKEVQRDSLAMFLRLPFWREVPAHLVRYQIKPLDTAGQFTMKAMPFNGNFTPPQRERNGYTTVTMTDVPASADEPFSLPAFEERPWLFIYYEEAGAPRTTDWQKFSKDLHDAYVKRAKANDQIKAMAAAVAGTTIPERMASIIGAIRGRVKRIDVDTADTALAGKARENMNAADVLKRGYGTGEDMALLTLAVALQAGMDARMAAVPDRSDVFHKQTHDHPYFVRARLIAVQSDGGWQFFDPSNEHSVRGELRWVHEWQEALVGDASRLVTARTKLSPPEASARRRTGVFRLLEDGTLEGQCVLVYSGHWAQILREQEDQDSPSEREKDLRDLMTGRLPGAEFTEIRIENVENPAAPYVNMYNVRIPNYAQRAGGRLLLGTGFFQRGVPKVFSSDTRQSGIYFQFPWVEFDDVTIEIPESFTPDLPQAELPLDIGAAQYQMSLTRTPAGALRMSRQLVVGRNDAILFQKTQYPALKKFFDEVDSRDRTLVVLRPKAGQ